VNGTITRSVSRWLGAAGVLGLAVGAAVAAAPAASAAPAAPAGSRFGPCTPGLRYPNVNSCDGFDPSGSFNSSTGANCSAGAWTVHSEPALGGTLELRWGPNCQTNWTRFTPGNSDEYELWVTRLDDGVWAGTGVYSGYYVGNIAGKSAFTDQVYSPGPAAACVADVTRGGQVCYKQPS